MPPKSQMHTKADAHRSAHRNQEVRAVPGGEQARTCCVSRLRVRGDQRDCAGTSCAAQSLDTTKSCVLYHYVPQNARIGGTFLSALTKFKEWAAVLWTNLFFLTTIGRYSAGEILRVCGKCHKIYNILCTMINSSTIYAVSGNAAVNKKWRVYYDSHQAKRDRG